ncbi:MAG: hypothetical protein NTX03_03645 [Bacteroidetes bacterium]|nr:hypothetical protein [Bacteroidota bacterium]
MINGNHFFCTSGAGFDAYVGYLFAGSKTRGISTYLKIILKNLFSYKAQEYTLVSDENTATHKAFLVTIANANQYGNDTFIAPHADIQDGHLDVCFIKPFPLWQIPFLGIKIMNGTVGKSKYYHTYKTKKIEVHRNAKAAVHYDGEPALMDELLTVEVLPAALKVIAGVGF